MLLLLLDREDELRVVDPLLLLREDERTVPELLEERDEAGRADCFGACVRD